jgi:hypothetical protein
VLTEQLIKNASGGETKIEAGPATFVIIDKRVYLTLEQDGASETRDITEELAGNSVVGMGELALAAMLKDRRTTEDDELLTMYAQISVGQNRRLREESVASAASELESADPPSDSSAGNSSPEAQVQTKVAAGPAVGDTKRISDRSTADRRTKKRGRA